MARNKQVNISVTDDEFEQIRRAAEKDERKTAAWIRRVVLREVREELGYPKKEK